MPLTEVDARLHLEVRSVSLSVVPIVADALLQKIDMNLINT